MLEPSFFEESQALVVRLTDEVSRLRVERNASRSSLESVSEELVRSREERRIREAEHERCKSEMEVRMGNMYDLCEKLVEKCEKLTTINDLHVLERRKLEVKLQEVEEVACHTARKRASDQRGIEGRLAALVKDRDDAIQHNQKLQDYIMVLEKGMTGTHEKVKGEAEQANQYRRKLMLAYEEIAILRKFAS
jgi:hypothetical protein